MDAINRGEHKMSQWPKSWSRFQSADQMQTTKEDYAEEIREWVRQANQYAGEMKTLVKMSRKDLSDLYFAVEEAKSKATRQQPAKNTSLARTDDEIAEIVGREIPDYPSRSNKA
jgi:hypothetical protein